MFSSEEYSFEILAGDEVGLRMVDVDAGGEKCRKYGVRYKVGLLGGLMEREVDGNVLVVLVVGVLIV